MHSRTLPARALPAAIGFMLLLGGCGAPQTRPATLAANDPTSPLAAEAPLAAPSQTLTYLDPVLAIDQTPDSADDGRVNDPSAGIHARTASANRPTHDAPATIRATAAGPAASEMPATGAAAKALYTCTMHPRVLSDEPGKCPRCGMKLVVQKGAAAPDPGDAGAHGGHE